MSGSQVHVHRAVLAYAGDDVREVGAAVTTRLCGHWEHEGECRWPHHNDLAGPDGDGRCELRTVFVAVGPEASTVHAAIAAALAAGPTWQLRASGPEAPTPAELELGARLVRGRG